MLRIGILALQGGFSKHLELLKKLECNTFLVKTAHELKKCQGLIIPGGESTTMLYHIKAFDLLEPLLEFAKSFPIFGTCAGAILLSSEVVSNKITPFSLIDMTVQRNAFGRQVESFSAPIFVGKESVQGVFIRAPKIKRIGPSVKILASYQMEPVFVQQGHYLAATFHPELSDDVLLHRLFLKIVKEKGGS